MSPNFVDSEGGKSLDRTGSEKKVNRFPCSAPYERLTYGVKGTEVTPGVYIEAGRCLYGSSPS